MTYFEKQAIGKHSEGHALTISLINLNICWMETLKQNILLKLYLSALIYKTCYEWVMYIRWGNFGRKFTTVNNDV